MLRLSKSLGLAGLLAVASLIACAAPTLPAGADQNAAASNGGTGGSAGDDDDDSTNTTAKKTTKKPAATTGDDDDDSTNTAAASNNTAAASSGPPQTFDAVYNELQNCAGCHTSGPGPAFYGADEPSSYTSFKAMGGSNIAAKGAHEGPALTSDQTAAVQAWIAADPNAG